MPKLTVDFGWGLSAAQTQCLDVDALIVVDCLSFSTTTDIATSRGALIIPCQSREGLRLDDYSNFNNLYVARKRREGGLTLSPSSMIAAKAGMSIVLPSPNGSQISHAVANRTKLFAGCLRNASSIANYIVNDTSISHVSVIAAGERWPDGSLRPALEDELAAGMIINKLNGTNTAEAEIAAAAYSILKDRIVSLIENSVSGKELSNAGYGTDVTFATEIDVSQNVPIWKEGAYRSA